MMKNKKTVQNGTGFDFESAVESAKKEVAYWQEDLLVKVAESLSSAMEEARITKAELARKLNVSAPYVTKILRGHENMTLATLAAVAFALEKQWDFLLLNLDESIHSYGAVSSTGAARIRPARKTTVQKPSDEDVTRYESSTDEHGRHVKREKTMAMQDDPQPPAMVKETASLYETGAPTSEKKPKSAQRSRTRSKE